MHLRGSQTAVALVGGHIRLGTHPDKRKTPRVVTIPKPGKDNFGLAKSYRVTLLLNCLGKIFEKVAAMMVSAHCGTTGGSHPGQYGCRARRPAVDTVGVTIAQSQGPRTDHRRPPHGRHSGLPQCGQGLPPPRDPYHTKNP